MARAGVINEEGVDPRALRPGKERVGGVTRTITREALQKSVAENVTHSKSVGGNRKRASSRTARVFASPLSLPLLLLDSGGLMARETLDFH